MAKEFIIAAHGVGIKEAGVSADLLSTFLESMPEAFYGPKRDTSDVTPIRSKDDKERATRDVCGFSLNPAQPAYIAEEKAMQ